MGTVGGEWDKGTEEGVVKWKGVKMYKGEIGTHASGRTTYSREMVL